MNVPCPTYQSRVPERDAVPLDEVIAKDRGNAELYLRRAELNRLHGDWAAAHRDIDRAAELAPNLAAKGIKC